MKREKQHAKALLLMLEKGNNILGCPHSELPWKEQRDTPIPCHICHNFINPPAHGCPCNILGCKEAVKRTWIALEAKGYI